MKPNAVFAGNRKREECMKLKVLLAAMFILVIGSTAAMAQMLSGPPANPQYKHSTAMPPGVAMPDKLDTRIGTLTFSDGVPDKASMEKIYENLDFQRAVQAYLLGLPVVNQVGNRGNILKVGPANTTV